MRLSRRTLLAVCALMIFGQAVMWARIVECRPRPEVTAATATTRPNHLDHLAVAEGNGGWDPQPLPPGTLGLHAVHPVDDNVVWSGGDWDLEGAHVVRTTDGGTTWERRSLPGQSLGITDLYAFDADTCLLGMENGDVWRTENGGLNWTFVQNVGNFINVIHFFDDLNGWIQGDPSVSMSFTIDTGLAAGKYPAVEGRASRPLASLPERSMSGPTIYVGTACRNHEIPPAPGPGFIALVQRGPCDDVETMTAVIDAGYDGMVMFDNAGRADPMVTISDVALDVPCIFVGHSTGLAIAGAAASSELVIGARGETITAVLQEAFNLWESSDGGVSWIPSPNPPTAPPDVYGIIHCYDWVGTQYGIFGTQGGTTPYFWTSDGGETWHEYPIGGVMIDVDLREDGTGLVGGSPSYGLQETTDFGETWAPKPGFPPSDWINQIECIQGTSEVWAQAYGQDPPLWAYLRSINGGSDWTQYPMVLDEASFEFEFLNPIRNPPHVDFTGWSAGVNVTDGSGRMWKFHEVVSVDPVSVPAPTRLALRVRPNPFNPLTMLEFELPEAGGVALQIFNTRGRLVRTLADARLGPGTYALSWNGRDQQGSLVPSGVYLARLAAGGSSLTQKVVLAR